MTIVLTRVLSFIVGVVASVPIPGFLRSFIYTAYGKMYGVKFEEVERALISYRSLGEFFSRSLVSGSRVISDPFCIPADGRISSCGSISNQELLQAKGKSYTIGELLLDGSLGAEFNGGSYFTIYLAPGDYHRVHSPVTGVLKSIRHISGALYPVSENITKRCSKVFVGNERVCLIYDTKEFGSVCVVLVGALNVGSISVDQFSIKTNQSFLEIFSPALLSVFNVEYAVNIGEEIGRFNLGSTVIVITQSNLQSHLIEGQKVNMGDKPI